LQKALLHLCPPLQIAFCSVYSRAVFFEFPNISSPGTLKNAGMMTAKEETGRQGLSGNRRILRRDKKAPGLPLITF
jgi:hypothetical protein